MKKQLILTAGIILSACSSNGQNSNSNDFAYNAPHTAAGQYQMAGYGHPMAAPQQMGAFAPQGGCAPAPVPTPCSMAAQAPVSPCGPAPVPTSPCAQAQFAKTGGFPWALGGAAAGAGALALLHNNSPHHPMKPFIRPPVKDINDPIRPIVTPTPWLQPVMPTVRPLTSVRHLQVKKHNSRLTDHMVRSQSQNGLRSSYMSKQKAYTYGEVGVVNQDAGKELGGVQTRLGFQSASIIGAEIEGSLGVLDKKKLNVEDLAVGETKMVGVDRSVAGFAVARVPMASGVKALARIGVHNSKVSYATRCAAGGGTQTGEEGKKEAFAVRPTMTAETTASSGSDLVAMSNPLQNLEAPVRQTLTGTEAGTTTASAAPESEGGSPCSTSSSKTHTGVAFGAGIEKELTPFDSIRADVTAYDMGDKFTKAVSVGYLRKF